MFDPPLFAVLCRGAMPCVCCRDDVIISSIDSTFRRSGTNTKYTLSRSYAYKYVYYVGSPVSNPGRRIHPCVCLCAHHPYDPTSQ